MLIDFSIRGFPDANEALENQVNTNVSVGEVCSVSCVFFMAP